MKIALAQLVCKLGDIDFNVSSMERLAHQAHAQGADAIVFPEMSDTGYHMPTILRTAAGIAGVPHQRLAALAKQLSMWVIAGLSLREGEKVYNTAAAFDRGGQLQALYRKIHLFSGMPDPEHTVLTAGGEHCVFELEGMPTGLMICYDLRFPELSRAITLAGAEMIIIPAAWPPVRVAHWDALLTARAIENQMYVIGVNRGGRDGDLPHGGHTSAVDPMGTQLYVSADATEQLAVVDVDPQRVRQVREHLKFLGDRRPSVYQT